ncbi:hypothetical protein COV11_00095 [Candidatus Woesearchaeota archaeon CG10_big_fil_rev_8_21_14_0_10_30_7]|nr:MAG: hypothetical protein COV11_00095 [Candidatus Woesearchaeota archaeon CG10_big_fil_rev_8_21_14_0_10_30_7]
MSWLRQLFKKREFLEFKTFKELVDYFSEKAQPIIEQESRIKSNLKEDFKLKIEELKEAVHKLKNAELRNPDIEERLKDYMTGNRVNYLHQINYFVKNLPDFDNDFGEKFKESINLFAEKTKRSNLVLREFFAHEIRTVSTKIAEINKLAEQISKPSKEWKKIDQIFNKINDYTEQNKKLKHLEGRSEEKEVPQVEKEVKKLEEQCKKLEKSEDHKEYLSLVDESKKQKVELSLLKDQIINLISTINRVLKKYERAALENQGLIHGYMKSTIDTFLLDKTNKIIKILENASKIELNDKDIEKLEKAKKEFNAEHLNNLRKKYSECVKETDLIIKKAENNSFVEKLASAKTSFCKKKEELSVLIEEIKEAKELEKKLIKENNELFEKIKNEIEDYCYVTIKLEL